MIDEKGWSNFKIKRTQFYIAMFFYFIPAGIMIVRHVRMSLEETTSISKLPFLIVGFILLVFYIIWSKKKDKIMKIIETKEIEDDQRTPKTIRHFYYKFALKYGMAFLALYYVQFNFKSLTGTMEWVALSLVVGSILRTNLARHTGK